ncbi:MAG: cytidyltransferase [Nitrospina sp.]|nr:cytidyltransferase [Nitrospina sp.]|tara:strand:+ start:7623 stop:9155 length:1533 start_codon:yes stop_codon:yes gene_type:complete
MSPSFKKIHDLDELEIKSKKHNEEGKRIVLCHGTFDLIHTGHIRHLQEAKKQGDLLFATITADRFVNKGPGRPVFSEVLRAENLSALSCVDFVGIVNSATAEQPITKIKPHIYVKGNEYKNASDDLTGNITKEKMLVEKFGGEIYFTNDITFSSTNLLNEHFGVFSEETRNYLSKIGEKHTIKQVIDSLDTLKNLNVLVLGDTIIDEYHYTVPLGQSAKGHHLAVKYQSTEQFAGGVLAVASHIAGFAGNVTVLTALGEDDSFQTFIRTKLHEKVKPVFFFKKNSRTLVKRRFVDMDLIKLFEVYMADEDELLPPELDEKVCSWLDSELSKFDVVIIPDFGHGFISDKMIQVLEKKSKYMAVNTQVNSGNRGYHAISRYSRADLVSLNEPELRLATHNRYESVETLAEKVSNNVNAKHVTITRGTNGAIMFCRDNKKTHRAPVLSTKVIDRIGAGDAFLSLAGIGLGAGLPEDLTTFVASAAAAIDVQIVCNRNPITSVDLYKYITTLLK